MDCVCFIMLLGLLALVAASSFEVGSEVIIKCPLENVTYPEWSGPVNLPLPLTNGTEFVEPGMEWDNEKNLKILSVETKHSGQYKCSSGGQNGLGDPVLIVLSYNVTVAFKNVEKQLGNDTDVVAGELDKELTVTCEVKGGSPAPVVTLAFEQGIENAPNIGNTVSDSKIESDNTYTVTASVTFMATAAVDLKNIICTSTYTGKDPVQAQIPMYLYIAPTVFGDNVDQLPTEELNEMVLSCDTESRPETSIVWSVDGKDLDTTELDAVESYQGCTENSTSRMFSCMSNITISNITKEDNGKMVTCDYVFRDTTAETSSKIIDLPFSATNIEITGSATGIVDDTGSVTFSLLCTAGPANPASTLKWYLVTNDTTLTSTYATEETDDMYNGKNVSQKIDVVANRTMNDQKVFCCTDKDMCTNVTLNIQYPPELLSPQLATYRAYVGDNISIPCIADSKPPAYIAWYSGEGDTAVQLSNNTEAPANIFYLELLNVTLTDALKYECRAWSQLQDISKAVSKSTQLAVFERPADPTIGTTFDADKYYIEIKTSATAPAIPRHFYIQYRKKGASSWLQVNKAFDDTLPGQEPVTYSYGFVKSEMEPETEYEIRVKSVDENGLATYSATDRLITDKDLVEVKEDTVSKQRYINAILISVFATAAFFLIIFLVIACAFKCGKVGGSSSKSYVM